MCLPPPLLWKDSWNRENWKGTLTSMTQTWIRLGWGWMGGARALHAYRFQSHHDWLGAAANRGRKEGNCRRLDNSFRTSREAKWGGAAILPSQKSSILDPPKIRLWIGFVWVWRVSKWVCLVLEFYFAGNLLHSKSIILICDIINFS